MELSGLWRRYSISLLIRQKSKKDLFVLLLLCFCQSCVDGVLATRPVRISFLVRWILLYLYTISKLLLCCSSVFS